MLHPVVGMTTRYQDAAATVGGYYYPALVVSVNPNDDQTVNLVFWGDEGMQYRRLGASARHPEGGTPYFTGGTDPDDKANEEKGDDHAQQE